jgi:hypothetical protein
VGEIKARMDQQMIRSFDELFARLPWKEIRGCPGRHILGTGLSGIDPAELSGGGEVEEYSAAGAPDVVLVARIDGGGLITYKKPSGLYLHTLNTEAGLRRKLDQLGIAVEAGPKK